MGFLDKLLGKGKQVAQSAQESSGEVVDKAKGMIADHQDSIDGAVDKVADVADKATGGKFSDHIDTAAEKVKDATENFADGDQSTN